MAITLSQQPDAISPVFSDNKFIMSEAGATYFTLTFSGDVTGTFKIFPNTLGISEFNARYHLENYTYSQIALPSQSVLPNGIRTYSVDIASSDNLLHGATYKDGFRLKYPSIEEASEFFKYTLNYIPVLPNKTYIVSRGATHQGIYYDSNKDEISAIATITGEVDSKFTTPSNCYFIRINVSVIDTLEYVKEITSINNLKFINAALQDREENKLSDGFILNNAYSDSNNLVSYFNGVNSKLIFDDLTGVNIVRYEGTTTLPIVGNEIHGTKGSCFNLLLDNGEFYALPHTGEGVIIAFEAAFNEDLNFSAPLNFNDLLNF